MTFTTRTLLIGLLSLLVIGLPVLPEGTLRALQVEEHRVPLAFAEDGGGAWISAPVEGDNTIAGLTWDDPEAAPDGAEVRVRVSGEWSRWEDVVIDDEHAPDPGSQESVDARGGTSPIIVEGADAVQFRITDSDIPDDLAADIVSVDDPDATRRIRERPSAASASAAQPAIHPRSDWGGNACPGRDADDYVEYADQVHVMFVHHTAGKNTYAQSEVPAIIRGICSYHVNSRGWDDIGYNALVDRYGGIWEGRAGGIDKAVQGAHTGGFNNDSTGVVFMGNHEDGAPTTAAQTSLVRFAAWKLDVHNVDPLGTSWLTSAGSSRYAKGASATMRNISGHRDASATSCPGWACYTLLNRDRPDNIPARVDAIGGFRIFGGWAQKHTFEQENGSWERPVFGFRFSEPANWRFELRGPEGQVVLTDSGTTSDPVYIEWDATIDGKPAPKGPYTTHITARRVSDGATASDADHIVELGGTFGDFSDVSSTNPFQGDITWLAEQEITLGCNPPTNTRFCPDGEVTRGQMAAFLTRALGLEEAPDAGFRDVPRSHTFHADISRLAAAGITLGCNPPTSDLFCPDRPVTREQMAAFLTRGLDLAATDHPGFRDVRAGSTFDDHIRRLAAADITRGCNPPTNDQYCPRDPVTRAQMAAFLRRGLEPS